MNKTPFPVLQLFDRVSSVAVVSIRTAAWPVEPLTEGQLLRMTAIQTLRKLCDICHFVVGANNKCDSILFFMARQLPTLEPG